MEFKKKWNRHTVLMRNNLFSFSKRLQKCIWKWCLLKSSAAFISYIIDQYKCRGKQYVPKSDRHF